MGPEHFALDQEAWGLEPTVGLGPLFCEIAATATLREADSTMASNRATCQNRTDDLFITRACRELNLPRAGVALVASRSRRALRLALGGRRGAVTSRSDSNPRARAVAVPWVHLSVSASSPRVDPGLGSSRRESCRRAARCCQSVRRSSPATGVSPPLDGQRPSLRRTRGSTSRGHPARRQA